MTKELEIYVRALKRLKSEFGITENQVYTGFYYHTLMNAVEDFNLEIIKEIFENKEVSPNNYFLTLNKDIALQDFTTLGHLVLKTGNLEFLKFIQLLGYDIKLKDYDGHSVKDELELVKEQIEIIFKIDNKEINIDKIH